MIEYPKIETLYNRDEKTFKVIPTQIRLPEFWNIKTWSVTEKVDGTNVRVHLSTDGVLTYGGRTASAQMPVTLVNYLKEKLPIENVAPAFDSGSDVTLFGEGYGEKIQSGGNYRRGVSFRLFDVLVGTWWLEPDDVRDVARALGVNHVPYLNDIDCLPTSKNDLLAILGGESEVSKQDGGGGRLAEGIVARTSPLMFTRRGERVMWKLKFRDF